MLFRYIPQYPKHLLSRGTRRYLIRLDLMPAQTLALSYAVSILLGAFCLMLPASAAPGHVVRFLDALFISTSALCVTGLATIDPATTFTPFGQGVILFLIQLGAIGIMTFAAVFAAVVGGGLGIRDRLVMQDVMDLESTGAVGRLLKAVFKVTLTLEIVGAALLYFLFAPYFPTHGQVLFAALFHAVSAFANAGFSTFSDNLMGFRSNVGINLVIMTLVIVGGLGFPVLINLRDALFTKGERIVLTLHTKITLSMTAILLTGGTLLLMATEWGGLFRGMPLWESFMTAAFHSTIARTAGFNTVDVSLIGSGALLTLAVLMFIGGGTGSTAGGVKTSTVAILFSSVRALIRGRETPELFQRSIPKDVLMKATAIFTLAIIGLISATLVLSLTETAPLSHLLLETGSALGTVGLSMGLTPHLSPMGKFIVTFLMFIGRIGPLALVLAIGQRRKKGLYYYPEERIMMG